MEAYRDCSPQREKLIDQIPKQGPADMVGFAQGFALPQELRGLHEAAELSDEMEDNLGFGLGYILGKLK